MKLLLALGLLAATACALDALANPTTETAPVLTEASLKNATEPAHEDEEEDDGEKFTSHIAVAISMFALGATFTIGYFVEEYLKWSFLPEAAIAVSIGAILSGLFYAGQYGDTGHIDDYIKFNGEFFFVWLLPPIIFEAGYNMRRRAFFDNIVPTVLYAFFGTFISTVIVGALVYAAGEAGLCHQLGVLPSFVFGALISATDPVTVLAVFQSLGVDINLFSMVFGESVLNDAVALVLYRSLLQFKHTEFNGASVASACGVFSEIFVLSLLIGLAMGILCALTFKFMDLRHHEQHRYMEASLTIIFPWASYFLAESFDLSGIVAIMFAGIAMANYAFDNLSAGAQELTQQMYKVAAKVAETFVFIYLGMSVFSFQGPNSSSLLLIEGSSIRLITVAIIACLIARVFNVYPFSLLVNLFRNANTRMPPISSKFMFVMWWSGLRGGVAFAIAVANYSDQEFPENNNGLAILQATLFVAIFTIFVFGGSITKLAQKFEVLEDKTAPQVVQEKRTGWMHDLDNRLKAVLSSPPLPHSRLSEEEGAGL